MYTAYGSPEKPPVQVVAEDGWDVGFIGAVEAADLLADVLAIVFVLLQQVHDIKEWILQLVDSSDLDVSCCAPMHVLCDLPSDALVFRRVLVQRNAGVFTLVQVGHVHRRDPFVGKEGLQLFCA